MNFLENLPLLNKLPGSFIRYSIAGCIVAVVDIGSFMLLLFLGLYRPVSAGIAFSLGVGSHFSLNKWFSFKSFERKVYHQARTYIIVSGLLLLTTVFMIEIMVRTIKITPFFAKTFTAIINLPLSFLGHKYLTFNKGIRARYKQITAQSAESRK